MGSHLHTEEPPWLWEAHRNTGGTEQAARNSAHPGWLPGRRRELSQPEMAPKQAARSSARPGWLPRRRQELQAGQGVPSFPLRIPEPLSARSFQFSLEPSPCFLPLASFHLNTQIVYSLRWIDKGPSCICNSIDDDTLHPNHSSDGFLFHLFFSKALLRGNSEPNRPRDPPHQERRVASRCSSQGLQLGLRLCSLPSDPRPPTAPWDPKSLQNVPPAGGPQGSEGG